MVNIPYFINFILKYINFMNFSKLLIFSSLKDDLRYHSFRNGKKP